jgi:hypothetical protein
MVFGPGRANALLKSRPGSAIPPAQAGKIAKCVHWSPT